MIKTGSKSWSSLHVNNVACAAWNSMGQLVSAGDTCDVTAFKIGI